MKKFLIAVTAAALIGAPLGSVASARSTSPDVTVKQTTKHKKQRSHVTTDGYYSPGIPKSDPGRYSNLPGKDREQSKAYIQDH